MTTVPKHHLEAHERPGENLCFMNWRKMHLQRKVAFVELALLVGWIEKKIQITRKSFSLQAFYAMSCKYLKVCTILNFKCSILNFEC